MTFSLVICHLQLISALFLYWLLMRSRWWFGRGCCPPVPQPFCPWSPPPPSVGQSLPLAGGSVVIHFLTSHKAAPSATSPSLCQQLAWNPSTGMFPNSLSQRLHKFPSASPWVTGESTSCFKGTTDIVFQLATNHTCLSAKFPLWSLQLPSFFFPTNLALVG